MRRAPEEFGATCAVLVPCEAGPRGEPLKWCLSTANAAWEAGLVDGSFPRGLQRGNDGQVVAPSLNAQCQLG